MKQRGKRGTRLFLVSAVMLLGLSGCNKAIEDENLPVATNTPVPTEISTPVPMATNTPVPTATNTPTPTPILATEADAFEYVENTSGSVTIIKLIDTSLMEVTIPSVIDGKPVTEIKAKAFASCETLVNVEVPDSVTYIGNGAFGGCTNLKSITLPFVGEEADGSGSELFGYIFGESDQLYHAGKVPTSLTKVTITGGSKLGDYAFYNCSSIKELNIPDSITGIGEAAFMYCSGLKTIDIPAGVTEIGEAAFSYCRGLDCSIKLPEGITEISDSVFYECEGITAVDIPAGVTEVGAKAFYGCEKLTAITLPENLSSIGNGAFNGCSGIGEIKVPDTVTHIGSGAFGGCTKLKSITLPFVGEEADGSGSELFGYIFGGSDQLYHAGKVPTSLTKVTITGGSKLGDYAFYNCSSIKELNIPDSITSIGEAAFKYCSSLKKLHFAGGSEQWKKMSENTELSECVVSCSDGEVEY